MKLTKNSVSKCVLNFHLDWIEINGYYKKSQSLRDKIERTELDIESDWEPKKEFEYDGFTCEYKTKLRNYDSKLTLKKNGVACFAIYEGRRLNKFVHTKDYIAVYGKAFRIFTQEEILEFIESNVSIQGIKRLDLTLDISAPIEDVLGHFNPLAQNGRKHFGKKGEIQTYEIGVRDPRKNPSLFIRIYDKIAEIIEEKTQVLYANFLEYPAVTRVELEFRSDLCKNLPFEKLRDTDYLLGLFTLYIEKHTSLFENLGNEKVEKLKRGKLKTNEKAKSDLNFLKMIPVRYKSAFYGYAKNILHMGGDPVDMLLRERLLRYPTVQKLEYIMKAEGRMNLASYDFLLIPDLIHDTYNEVVLSPEDEYYLNLAEKEELNEFDNSDIPF